MAKLTGQTIAASYDQLLIVDHADGISSSLQSIESADTGGSSSALKISTVGIEVDTNFTGTTTATTKGAHIDFDATGITASGQTATNIGLDLDMNSNAPTMVGTVNNTGIDLDMVAATSGVQKNVGLDIAVSGADTNYALITSGGNVGLGNSAPSRALEISASATNTYLQVSTYSTSDSQTSYLALTKSASATINTEAATADGESLGTINFAGVDSSNAGAGAATIRVEQDGSAGSNEIPGRMIFATGTSSATPADRMYILSDGKVGIGATPTAAKLEVHGGVYNTSLLIKSSGTNGGIKFVDSGGTTDGYVYAVDGDIGFLDDDGDWAVKVDTDTSTSLLVANVTKLLVDANSKISLSNNDSGTSSTIFGKSAGNAMGGAANRNVCIGESAGQILAGAADDNCIVGTYAFDAADGTESYNTVIGNYAMSASDEGAGGSVNYNVAVGYNAALGGANANFSNCVAIGANALDGTSSQDIDGIIAIGRNAMGGALEDDGIGQIAIGVSALVALSTGEGNVAIGYNAALGISTADGNTVLGHRALDAAHGASDDNVAIGMDAMGAVTDSNGDRCEQNVCIGTSAGFGGNPGSGYFNENVIIGYNAGSASNTRQVAGNVFIGKTAASGTMAGDGATYNVGVGQNALSGALNGATHNIGIGLAAGDVITTGDENICIGGNSDPSAVGGQNQIVIGYATTGIADDTVTLGNADITDVYMAADSGAYVHSQNVPNHLSNTMSSPHYRFDGADDYMTVADNAKFRNLFDGGGSWTAWVYPNSDGENNQGRIMDKGSGGQWRFQGESGGKLEMFFFYDFSTTDGTWSTTSAVVPINLWSHVAVTYDNHATGNDPKFYLNGVEITSVTKDTTPVGTRVAETDAFFLMANTASPSRALDGEISKVQLWNTALSATEVKELYSGASVPWKYKGANQTNMVTTAADGDFSGSGNWASNGNHVVTITGGEMSVAASGASNGSGNAASLGYSNFTDSGGTVGKAYNYRFRARASSGTPTLRVRTPLEWGGTNTEDFTLSTTMQSFEISTKVKTAAENAYFGLLESGTFIVDDVELVPAGAVAEFDGSGVASDKWFDKSGNDLHGTIGGATVENTAGAPVISANHPAFLARPSGSQTDIANSGVVDVVLGAEVFDQGDNFASNTFTAPVTGKYQLNATATLVDLRTDAAYYEFRIITSNRNYESAIIDPDAFDSTVPYWHLSVSVLADMDASDTAKVAIVQSGGTASTDINTNTHFSGFLVC